MELNDKINLGCELQNTSKALIVKSGVGKVQCELNPIMWKFFYTFLSQINPVFDREATIEDRTVEFSFKEFCSLMDIDIHGHTRDWEDKISQMMSVCVFIDQKNGPEWINFFERTKLFTSGEMAGTVRMVATESVQELIFNLAAYAPFKLEYIAKLQSNNSIALYTLLKTRTIFEDTFEISVEELKEKLYIKKDEYKRFDNLIKRVLEPCRKYIGDNTDIRFTYEAGKTGKYGRWESISFHVTSKIEEGEREVFKMSVVNSVASSLRNNRYVNKQNLTDRQLVDLATFAFDVAVIHDNDEKKASKELEFYLSRKLEDVERQIEKKEKKTGKNKPAIPNVFGYVKKCIKTDRSRIQVNKALVESMYDKAVKDISNREEETDDSSSEETDTVEFCDPILEMHRNHPELE